MKTRMLLAFASMLLLPMAVPPPTAPAEEACTPRPDPLIFNVRIAPSIPRWGMRFA